MGIVKLDGPVDVPFLGTGRFGKYTDGIGKILGLDKVYIAGEFGKMALPVYAQWAVNFRANYNSGSISNYRQDFIPPELIVYTTIRDGEVFYTSSTASGIHLTGVDSRGFIVDFGGNSFQFDAGSTFATQVEGDNLRVTTYADLLGNDASFLFLPDGSWTYEVNGIVSTSGTAEDPGQLLESGVLNRLARTDGSNARTWEIGEFGRLGTGRTNTEPLPTSLRDAVREIAFGSDTRTLTQLIGGGLLPAGQWRSVGDASVQVSRVQTTSGWQDWVRFDTDPTKPGYDQYVRLSGVQTARFKQVFSGQPANESAAGLSEFGRTATVISDDVYVGPTRLPLNVGEISAALGSTLASILIDGDRTAALGGALISAVTENVGEAIALSMDSTISLSGAFKDTFRDFFADIGANVVGAVSSILTAELIDELGLEGTLVGDLGNTVLSSALSQVIINIGQGAANPFAGVQISPATILATYAAGKLAAAVWTPNSVYGQIGAGLGSSIGTIVGAGLFTSESILFGVKLGSFAGPLGMAIGAFVGYLAGGLIGSMFGASKSSATIQWDGDQFLITNLSSKRGGSKDAARSLAEAITGTLDGMLAITGSRFEGTFEPENVGMRNKDYVYWNAPAGVTSRSRSFGTIVNAGVWQGLRSMIGGLIGGDVIAKRALAAGLAMVDANSFQVDALYGDLSFASDYSAYLADPSLVNALIALDEQSATSVGWKISLVRAYELGLNKRSVTDWLGGWNAYADEMFDGVIDGLGYSAGNIVVTMGDDGERKFVFLNASGETDFVAGDTISLSEKDWIAGSNSADVITVTPVSINTGILGRLTSNSGVKVGSDAALLNSFDIDVAALIDAGDGDDIVRAGDLGNDVLGGAGNDKIVGGKLDDWLFGDDGDDVLFAGDVVGAGVVTQAQLAQANATFTVGAAAATAVDGGNGDLLDGGAGHDRLYGGKGSDWLKGGDGVDALYGGAGGDILEGGAGDDQGASGAAAILGGAGTDQYVFGYGDGNDVIFDESDPAGVAGSTGDSLYTRISQINAGTLTRNWAGGGSYEVDGSVKGGEDAIVFGVGITMRNLIMKRSGTTEAPGQDLIIQLTADDPAGTLVNGHVRQVPTGDTLTIKDWFESTRKVEWLRFANGDEIRIADITSYVIGVAGSSVILGTNGSDWIVGTDGADKIYGLNGDDFGFGGLGNDMVSGDANNDLVSGGAGEDVVIGGAGNDTVLGDGEKDRVYGGAGKDILAGGRGDDVVVAGAGADVIRYARGDGQDVLIDAMVNNWDKVWQNGAYDPSYQLSAGGVLTKDGVVYFDGSKWIDGYNYDYVETTTGSTTTKTLWRHKGAVDGVVSANLGNTSQETDTVEFAVGIDIQDLMLRQVGNDLEVVVADVDTTGGFAGASDKITIKDWWSIAGVELRPIERFSFVATGAALLTYYTIIGGATDGADTLAAAATNSWITGGRGDDVLTGGAGQDILSGGEGADSLYGGVSSDYLYGGAGDDLIDGGSGADQIFGGSGTDILSFANSSAGASVRAFLGAAWANAGLGAGDVYSGIEGIEGGAASDRLWGDAGNNILRGLAGNDRTWGGMGDDTYEWSRGDGGNEILEGNYIIEEILNYAGVLNAAFTTTWEYLTYAAPTGQSTNYYQYRLTVRRTSDSQVVYKSRDGVDFLYTTAQATVPGGSAWPYADGQWVTGALRWGSGLQTTAERVVAGAGGNDTLALGPTISLSDLTMTRGTGVLNIVVTGAETLKIFDQQIADRAVETLQFADGLAVDLTALRLGAEAATAGVDLMIGDAAVNTLAGLAGDDVLSGGAGDDSLDGGAGNDVLEGGAGADTLNGGTDSQTDGLAVSASDPGGYGDTIRYVSSVAAVAIDLKAGTASGGDAQGDVIRGVNGVSTIENVVGSDAYGDQLTGDDRANRLFGLGGNDTLSGLMGDDVLVGGAGDDTLYAGDGDDALAGEDGVDRLEGGLGKDLLSGGAGADTLLGQAGDDQVTGDDGDDTLYGGDGLDTLGGGAGVDVLYGEAGDDNLVGGAGGDQLFGGDGNDVLVGETGDDTLDGGGGDDVYGFDANSGVDRVVDASGTNRIIINGVTSDRVWLTRSADDLKIAVIGGTSVVTVAGYYAATGASRIKEIALDGASLFLGHAQPLIDAMTAVSSAAPTTQPAAIATLAGPYWHPGGKAAPVAPNQILTTNEDTVIVGQVGAVDDDDNITAYAVVSAPTLGALNLNATTGAWTYTPAADRFGDERFVFSITDADGHVAQQVVALKISAVNDAPDSLTGPTVLKINENSLNGASVGQFTSTDPDGPTANYYLADDAGGRFAITSTGELKVKNGAALNYEALGGTSHLVRVGVTDGAGGSRERDFTVSVGNVNETPNVPGINTAPGVFVLENAIPSDRTVATFKRTDPDTPALTDNPNLTLQLIGDTQNLLEVVAGTGIVRFRSGATVNFEALANAGATVSTDTDANGGREALYTVKVQTHDGERTSAPVNLVLHVRDVNEAPSAPTLARTGALIYERDRIDTDLSPAAQLALTPAIQLGVLSATDPDLPSSGTFASLVYRVVDETRFEIQNGNQLWLRAGAMSSLNFEATSQTFDVAVTVTDKNGTGLPQGQPTTFTFALLDRDDIQRADTSGQTLVGESGRDLLYGYAGNNLISGGAGNDDLYGGDGDDVLDGEAGTDLLEGGLGKDRLSGGAGVDILRGGDGADTLSGGSENDTLYGEVGNDALEGDAGDDLLEGGDGNDQMSGGTGVDRLVGGLGDDVLEGGAGADRFLGGGGSDTLSYASAARVGQTSVGVTVNLVTGGSRGDAVGDVFEDIFERLVGSSFDDDLTGTAGADIIQGGAGMDRLIGNDGQDNLDGGAGDDVLEGGAGHDILVGSAGSDTMYGGGGDDVYVIDINSGADFIDAFDASGGKDSIGYQADTNGQNQILNSHLWFERPTGTSNLVISVIGAGVSTTILKWYDSTTGGNQKINFIIAGDRYTVNAEGLVTLMAGKQKPATADDYARMHQDLVFENQWRNHWFSNGAPVFDEIAEQTVTEDGSVTIQIKVTDDISTYANLDVTAKAVNASNPTLDDGSFINAPVVGDPDAYGNRTLTFTTKPNVSGRVGVKVTAVDPGGVAGEKVFYVNIDPRADTPAITQARPSSGTLALGPLALDIQAALTDQDGSETLEIRIANVPTGLTLNKGTLSNGVWSLTPAQLTGLALVGPATWSADLTGAAALTVTAISSERANGSTASYGPTDNQLANSRFLTGQANWQMATNKAAGTTTWGSNLSIDWTGSGNDVLFSTMHGAQAAGGLVDIRSELLATKAGATYETSVMAAQHRGLAELWIEYYAADNSLISAIKLSGSARESGARFGDPANFNQLGGVTTAPVGAVGRRVNLRLASTTGSDPYAFFMRPISRPTAQSTLGDWSQFYPRVLNVPINARPTGLTANAALTIAENTVESPIPVNKAIATFSATDPDADTLTYTLVDGGDGWGIGANGRFKIGSSDGILRVDNTNFVNFESGGTVKVWVQAKDPGGLAIVKDFTVTVTNVNERPTAPAVSQVNTIRSEGFTSDILISTFVASDPDETVPTFFQSAYTYDWFYVSGNQLRLRDELSIDYEWLRAQGNDTWRKVDQDVDNDGRKEVAIAVGVSSTDGALNSASQTLVWYSFEDANDTPDDIWADRALSLAENSATGTVVGVFSRADQDASDAATYNLFNNTTPFALSGSTLVVVGALSYEAATSYSLTVRVTDPYGAYYDEIFTVAITDVNEAPSVGGATLSLNEATVSGTYLGSVSYSDPDLAGSHNANLRFALSGTGSEKFAINNSGQIFYQSGSIDYETQPHAYNLIVVARDQAGNGLPSQGGAVTINVGDVNEAPTVSNGTMSINELAGPGSYVGTLSYGDPDTAGSSNANLVFSLSGSGSEKFTINSSGQIFYQTGLLDFETQPHAYDLTVVAKDQGGSGLSSSASTVHIDVQNSDEAPTIAVTYSQISNPSIYNKSAVLTASDPEGAGPITWTVLSSTIRSGDLEPPPLGVWGNASSPSRSLMIKHIDWYDGGYEEIANYDFTVRLTDSTNSSADYTYRVTDYGASRIAPIMLDLDGGGVSTIAFAGSRVLFDQDGDGFVDQTGWVGAGDGLLVLDRNANGVIDDGSEIRFSTDEAHAISDLEGLRVYDTNENGFFDRLDAEFARFQVWRDANQDGVSQADELFSLDALQITAINLTLTPAIGTQQQLDENFLYGTTQFTRADGTVGQVNDVMLAYQGAPTITLVSSTAVAGSALLPPVVIDLDGDGVELIARAASRVRFDVAGDGHAVRTGWVGADDAFLALDRNGDGRITSGAEISFVGDRQGAVSDLEGLRAFDSNENGFLDAGDARFGEFRVWQDKNQDGVSQDGELRGLNDLGFKALNLTQRLTGASAAPSGNNVLYATSDLIKADGSHLTLGDVMLAFDTVSETSTTADEALLTAPFGSRPHAKPGLTPDWDIDRLIEQGLQDGGQEPMTSDELSGVDRTAASTLKPPAAPAALDEPAATTGSRSRPAADLAVDRSLVAPLHEALSPRSRSEIDLSGILDAAYRTPAGTTPIDYGDLTSAGARSALDAGLALAQQTRLQMIQAMAGFSREGAADFGPDALRRGHAQSLALLTALPDIRVR